jgi:TRAP-type C4-dicarboxylate transport system permease small subunit
MTVTTALADSVLRASVWLSQATPSPSAPPPFTGDEDSITPTWVGFAFTFAIAAITLFLIIDMVRRVRRVRYRSEIRERLEEEAAGEQQPPVL